MKSPRWIFLGLVGLAALLSSAYALVISRTFETAAQLYTFTQGKDTVTTLTGHNLVNLAMGRPATSTTTPHQVLALTFSCDHQTANLVVFDQATTGTVATIASASSVDAIVQTVTNQNNQLRILAQFELNATGNPANGLLGGYLTVAGRIRANRTNGCPETVAIKFDHDRHDHEFGDLDVPHSVDPTTGPTNFRNGLAHCMGVIQAVQAGSTNTLIIPFGHLSIRGVQP